MAINWFPGHMHKARKEIAKSMPEVDLIIELVDARIPFSSENPLVPKLRGNTPCIKVLNKRDLADPQVTRQWLDYFNSQEGVKAIALSQKQSGEVRSLLKLGHTLVPQRDFSRRPLLAMILGIPNVGKSTLINTLAGRVIAKTGNTPAVTKMQQRIKLPDDLVLLDTPGFLWPKLSPEECGYRLAVTGAIRDSILELEDVALFAGEYLLEAYPEPLQARFELEQLPLAAIDLFDAIGARRGCLRRGGQADLHKVSAILLNELRSGNLGPITLETPAMVAAELAATIGATP